MPRSFPISIGILTVALLFIEPTVVHGRDAIDRVEFEKMTWVEVKNALAASKTTALIYTGGVEERGPQNVNGGHNLMAHATVEAIARKLGNAIYLPVLPYSPNAADPTFPGTIGITDELLRAILIRLSEQSIVNGFKTVVLLGDHGGGQPVVYASVAHQLDEQYGSQGVHVYYCDQVYKVNADFDRYLTEHEFPPSLHGGVSDTSEMLYLDHDHSWVRSSELKQAIGSPVVNGRPAIGPEGPKNGIIGDARRSTAALGRLLFQRKVDSAVTQIREFQANAAKKRPLPGER